MRAPLISMFLFVLLTVLLSCSTDIEFDRNKWNEKDDIFFKYRKQMLNDLLEHHLNSQMTRKEIDELLGESNFKSSDAEFAYEVYVDYAWDIDPVEFQNLIITIGSDSTLDKVYLDTWKRSVNERVEYPVK